MADIDELYYDAEDLLKRMIATPGISLDLSADLMHAGGNGIFAADVAATMCGLSAQTLTHRCQQCCSTATSTP